MSKTKTAQERYDAYRAGCKEAAVATANRHFGPGCEGYCDELGNVMAAHLDEIWATAKFVPPASVAGIDTQELTRLMLEHAGKVAGKAVHAMEDLLSRTLIVAKMAYGGGGADRDPTPGSRAN